MKILTRPPHPSLRRPKSDRLLAFSEGAPWKVSCAQVVKISVILIILIKMVEV